MSDQPNQPKTFSQLHVAIAPDGSVKLGNCLHCVTTRQRPPVSQRAKYHPAGAVDLDETALLATNERIAQELAKLGIIVTDTVFVPKDSMPRATE